MKNLELLEKIGKVEAPDFLYTRIQQKIENLSSSSFTIKLALLLSFSFLMVIIINVAVLMDNSKQVKQQNNLVQSMNLMPDNSLYQ